MIRLAILQDINKFGNVDLQFPIIADPTREVAALYVRRRCDFAAADTGSSSSCVFRTCLTSKT